MSNVTLHPANGETWRDAVKAVLPTYGWFEVSEEEWENAQVNHRDIPLFYTPFPNRPPIFISDLDVLEMFAAEAYRQWMDDPYSGRREYSAEKVAAWCVRSAFTDWLYQQGKTDGEHATHWRLAQDLAPIMQHFKPGPFGAPLGLGLEPEGQR